MATTALGGVYYRGMKWGSKKKRPVEFDEILLDVSNLPSFNTARLEGRRELPISAVSIYLVAVVFALVSMGFFVPLEAFWLKL